MRVNIYFDNGDNYFNEVQYDSKYNRINARGIKDEAKAELIKRYGNHARNYIITGINRD